MSGINTRSRSKAKKEKEKGVESTEVERNNRGDNILEI